MPRRASQTVCMARAGTPHHFSFLALSVLSAQSVADSFCFRRRRLVVAFGGVAGKAAEGGDRLVVFEAVERAVGGAGVFGGAGAAVVQAVLRADRGDRLGQRIDVAVSDDRAQAVAGRGARVP